MDAWLGAQLVQQRAVKAGVRRCDIYVQLDLTAGSTPVIWPIPKECIAVACGG